MNDKRIKILDFLDQVKKELKSNKIRVFGMNCSHSSKGKFRCFFLCSKFTKDVPFIKIQLIKNKFELHGKIIISQISRIHVFEIAKMHLNCDQDYQLGLSNGKIFGYIEFEFIMNSKNPKILEEYQKYLKYGKITKTLYRKIKLEKEEKLKKNKMNFIFGRR